MTQLSEKRDVQNQLINHLVGIGWRYLPPDNVIVARGGDEAQPFLSSNACQKLIELNGGLLDEAGVDNVLRRLSLVRADLTGNEGYLDALRGRWTIYDPAARRERNLTLIDFENVEANDFTFTQELPFIDHDRRRMDMVLWINGLPVVVIENKGPSVPDGEDEGFRQVQETYITYIPEFIKYPPLFAVCDGIRLSYGPTWNISRKAFYRWKVDGHETGIERLSKTLFDRQQLLDILRDYVVFYRADDQTSKYVLRPHQMRTVEKIVARVAGREADSGLVWHTQGSGKSLTMIVAASRLGRLDSLANPTILIVVDRRELETQMAQNLEAFGFSPARAESREVLRDLLASDTRGLIVTLIHKFERMPKDINRSQNIVVLVDEAHRSQEGDLGIYMRAALPNAIFFGFTGTPVDRGRIGRGTFETFGKPDPTGYMDKYNIDESVEDGTTVPLYYTLTPSELCVDRDVLEQEFFQMVEQEGVASIEELNRILDHAEKLKAVLKAEDRVDQIARHIAQHYRENVEPLGFKAFVVAVDRECCALYKQALDGYLPPEYSQVVYTPYHKDEPLLAQYHIDDDQEKAIRKAFRDPDQMPQILIVTEKLLTGYDAPVLYAMYLDKPLKDHTLLQAIARVNRPYPDKSNGLIVDYIGIFENLQRALAFDSESVQTGLLDLQVLRESFAANMAQMYSELLRPLHLSNENGRVQRIVDCFFGEEIRRRFVELYKAIQQAYEILSPDPFLRDYLDAYALVTGVYQVVYNAYDPEAQRRKTERDLLAKTGELIREHVELVTLADTLPTYAINRDIATVVKSDNVSERVKINNLYRSLVVHIEQNKDQQPYLISIGEEVEAIIQRLKDRQIGVQAALEQLTVQAEQVNAAREEQMSSSLSGDAFALFWVLRGQGVADAEAVAEQVHGVLIRHASWRFNPKVEQQVRLELYKVLTPALEGREVTALKETVDNLLRVHQVLSEAK